MTKNDIINCAVAFISAHDNIEKDERWETAHETAEEVICRFLQSMSIPTWKVTLIHTNNDINYTTQRFVLESTAEKFISDDSERIQKSSTRARIETSKEYVK